MTRQELKTLRLSRRLTQQQFGLLAGYPIKSARYQISDLERGRHGISKLRADHIRRVFKSK